MSSSDETSQGLVIRKQSLRNITPRSYSSLLKSESEEEEEEEELKLEKPDKSAVRPSVAADSNPGE